MWRPLWAIVGRELTRMVRQRGRLVSALVRPLIWLLVIGTGMQGLLQSLGPVAYKQFMVPGLLSMVLLFGAMLAALSLVYDKESGVMRMLICAPFSRYWIILARTVSATIAALVQALLLIVVLVPLGYFVIPENLPLFVLGLVLTALVCAAMGMVIAVYSKTLDNFAVIMNFVIFPAFFLSGALYPLESLPVWLKAVALANPFSYGVDVLKHAMLADMPPPYAADFPVALGIGALVAFTAAGLTVACLRFSQARLLERLAKTLSGSRAG